MSAGLIAATWQKSFILTRRLENWLFTMIVLLFPPRAFWRSFVNCEFLNGTLVWNIFFSFMFLIDYNVELYQKIVWRVHYKYCIFGKVSIGKEYIYGRLFANFYNISKWSKYPSFLDDWILKASLHILTYCIYFNLKLERDNIALALNNGV